MVLPHLSPFALSRRKFLGLLGALTAGGLGGRGSAQGATIADSNVEVIRQNDSVGACGPCALSHSLLNGDAAGRRAFRQLPGANTVERVDALICLYGSKPSETYGPRRGRFLAGAGLTCEDMPFLVNDFLGHASLPEARGEWLDRLGDEPQVAHLGRVRGLLADSVAKGFPPVVEIRSFAADTTPSSKPSWVNLYAHWLSLLSVEAPVSGGSGFVCRFADSYTGKVIAGYAHCELNRPFMATRGFTIKPNGSQDWRWLNGYPYVLVEVPDLPLLLQTRPWQNRTLVALTYVVHRLPA